MNKYYIYNYLQKVKIYSGGGRGHWAVYYISPQSFMIKFSYSLA